MAQAAPPTGGYAYRLDATTVAYDVVTGVANDVTISRTGTGFRIHDAAGTVQAIVNSAPDCTQFNADTADCPAAASDHLIVVLEDQGDHLTVTATTGPGTLLCGGDGADTITGGPSGSSIRGGGGGDTLTGGAGTDVIDADAPPSPDALCDGSSTTPAPDTLDGAGGTDFLQAGSGGDTLSGGPGLDGLCGGSGADTLFGGDDVDTLVGGGGNDTLHGGPDVDVLQSAYSSDPNAYCPGTASSSEQDTLYGDDGNDVLIGAAGTDTLDGGPGDDSLFGFDGNDVLTGGDGSDVMVGYAGADTLDGGPGVDELGGGDGDDIVRGGDGNDELGITLSVPAGDTPAPHTLVTENGADTLGGGPGDDTIAGGPGATVLDYGGTTSTTPADTAALNGADSITGGDGRDTVTYVHRTSQVSVSLDGAGNDGGAGEGDNVAGDVETVIGGAADDTLTGGAGGDVLDGGKGSDTLRGGDGPDDLRGGGDDEGRDTLEGGAGDDTLHGDAGDDTIAGGDGVDTADGGGGNDTVLGDAGNDPLSGGTGADTIDGGPGDDSLSGGGLGLVGADAGDVLAGGEGDDTMSGGDGDDTLTGGPGVDTFAGDAGNDTADYGAATVAVNVTLDGLANDGPAGERDNVARDVESVRSGSGDDDLRGSDAGNRLESAAGEDFVLGGNGSDDVQSGDGADFVSARDGTPDRVTCGAGEDIASVDVNDTVSNDCEHPDSGDSKPKLAGTVALTRIGGGAAVRPPWAHRFFPLSDGIGAPVGTAIEATSAKLTVGAARKKGRAQSAGLTGGSFVVRQSRRSGLVALTLTGGGAAGCVPAGRVLRRLDVSARGLFQTNGRRATAASTSRAVWTMEDRCGGTFVRVKRGHVNVRDLGRKRTVRLNAGKSYLAKR